MRVVEQGQLKGSFAGFKDVDTIFEFQGGGKWRQAVHKHFHYHFHMPSAKVVEDGGRFLLHVQGINDPVEVRRA